MLNVSRLKEETMAPEPNNWPSYIEWENSSDQVMFEAYAKRNAPTGLSYNHYRNGNIITFSADIPNSINPLPYAKEVIR